MNNHCHIDWGVEGARLSAERNDIIVIVDTLSFSSTTITALDKGMRIFPCSEYDLRESMAAKLDAQPSYRRREAHEKGRLSLSPSSFLDAERTARVVLYSLNGGSVVKTVGRHSGVFIGALVNAAATADAVRAVMDKTGRNATVVACGEKYHDARSRGKIRFALEDYLGAGAIIAHMGVEKTAEAKAAEAAFAGNRDNILDLLLECDSGRELLEQGFEKDVHHCAGINLYDFAAIVSEPLKDHAVSEDEDIVEIIRHRAG